MLKKIVRAPWFVSNKSSQRFENSIFIKKIITKCTTRYVKTFNEYPNHVALSLLNNSENCNGFKGLLNQFQLC